MPILSHVSLGTNDYKRAKALYTPCSARCRSGAWARA